MTSKLYAEVIRELNDLDNMMFYTPYLGKRKAILEQLKSHIEEECDNIDLPSSSRPECDRG